MDETMEFELPLAPDHFAPHRELWAQISDNKHPLLLVARIFRMVAALCDPMTQPEDSEQCPLSVAVLGDVCVLLGYQLVLEERAMSRLSEWTADVCVALLKFTLLLRLFDILNMVQRVLSAESELRVRYLRNDVDDWHATARHWLPQLDTARLDDPDACLKVLYYASCVIVMALHKLFLAPDGACVPAQNPYLEYFVRLWKTHTSIVALALEMDRELEEKAFAANADFTDTPDLVRCALVGLLAVRTVLAYVLAHAAPLGPLPALKHDVSAQPMLDFLDPLARTADSCGAVLADHRMLAVAALVLRLRADLLPTRADKRYVLQPLTLPFFDAPDLVFRAHRRQCTYGYAGDLLTDLYYKDQFDEDIKYMFGYYHLDDDSADAALLASSDIPGLAKRLRADDIEFDAEGRDWRDCARGQNMHFDERFLRLEEQTRLLGDPELSQHFFYQWAELQQALDFLALAKIEHVDAFVERVGQVTVDTIAKAVKDESKAARISPDTIHKDLVLPAALEFLMRTKEEVPLLSLVPITNFELVLLRNPECALAILDELFMCKGLRRLLIWFLTHSVNPLMSLINYLYELVAGLRGNSKREAKFRFSRVGPLEISQVEELMILHELFSNACQWFAQEGEDAIPELNALRLVSYLCLMILRLLKDGIMKINEEDFFEDYSHDIQVLLFPWIGKVAEARMLFFRFKAMRTSSSEKLKPEAESQKAEVELPTLLPLDIEVALDQLRGLDDDAYAAKIQDPVIKLAFKTYGQKLVLHIFREHHSREGDVEHNLTALEDYHKFIEHYNELSRNTEFVREMFDLLEDWVMGDRPGNKEEGEEEDTAGKLQENGADEPLDSEFSENFFNGHAESSTASKKKSKKKKKQKKR